MPPRPSLHLAAVALVAAAACKSATSGKGAAGAPCRTDADCAAALLCTDAPAGKPATPGKPQCAPPARAYTFRALAGVSMGAVGTSRLAAAHPDKLDAAGMLGGPLDATLLL